MALTKEQENKFDEVLRDAMKKQFYRGLSVGAQSVSKVIYDLLTDSSLPLMKRLESAKKYCSRNLQNGKLVIKDEKQEQAQQEKNNGEVTEEEINPISVKKDEE